MSNSPALPLETAGAEALSSMEVRRGVKALVQSSERVLLVKERHACGREFWTLPGGGVRSEEGLEEGLRRELMEELRCTPVVRRPLSELWYAHLNSPGTVSRYAVFSCGVVSTPQPVRSEGILDAAWVEPDRLPAGTLPQVQQFLEGADV